MEQILQWFSISIHTKVQPVETALIREKKGLTDIQKNGWKDMKMYTGAVRDYAIRPKRTYCKSKFSQGILKNITLIKCEKVICAYRRDQSSGY
jgi:hypothetical protein